MPRYLYAGGWADARLVLDGRTLLFVRCALTPLEQERGLNGYPPLIPGKGMLFVFGTTEPRAFTFRDVLQPLDLALVRQGSIVYVASPEPGSLYMPPVAFDAAIELPRGWLASRGHGAGSVVRWAP